MSKCWSPWSIRKWISVCDFISRIFQFSAEVLKYLSLWNFTSLAGMEHDLQEVIWCFLFGNTFYFSYLVNGLSLFCFHSVSSISCSQWNLISPMRVHIFSFFFLFFFLKKKKKIKKKRTRRGFAPRIWETHNSTAFRNTAGLWLQCNFWCTRWCINPSLTNNSSLIIRLNKNNAI